MLLPEQMAKVLIVGSKDHLERTVDLLYESRVVHLVDFPPDKEGFTLGSPLPIASKTSERLLRLRAIEKDLGIKEPKVPEPLSAERIRKEIDAAIISLDSEILDVIGSKAKLEERLSELDQQKRDLQPLASLPLDLELYRDFRSLTVFVGHVRTDPSGVLQESLDQFEALTAQDGKLIAVFVQRSEANEAQRILMQYGFSEVSVPQGTGKPAEVLNEIQKEESILRKSYEEDRQPLTG